LQALTSLTSLLGVAIVAATASAEPAWPATGTTLDLTWRVEPVHRGGAIKTSLGRVELVATLGTVTRTFPLGEVPGSISPLDQPMCTGTPREAGAPPPLPYGKNEVAKLVFGGGIVRGLAVRRAKRDQLEIVAFDMGDESCGKPHDCPPKAVQTIAIPARVKTVEHIEYVGTTAKFSCKI
jgi:hypothetical protein